MGPFATGEIIGAILITLASLYLFLGGPVPETIKCLLTGVSKEEAEKDEHL